MLVVWEGSCWTKDWANIYVNNSKIAMSNQVDDNGRSLDDVEDTSASLP